MLNYKICLISAIILSLFRFCISEELLELACQNVTYCKQFQHDDVLVHCLEGRCQCSKANGKRVNCKPKEFKQNNIIGGACPCNLPSAECNVAEDVCYCAPHYVASADRRRCLQMTVALGAACELDAQCMGGDIYAVCNATLHRCECRPNFAIHEGACKASVSKNDGMAGTAAACRNDTECQAFEQLALCSDNLCLCPIGYVGAPNRTRCIAITDFQKSCSETAQCLRNLGPGAKCHHDVCHCADGYMAQEHHSSDGNTTTTTCERIVELGNYCRTNMDCHQQHLSQLEQTMYCFYGECNCKTGLHSKDNVNCSSGTTLLALNLLNLMALALCAFCWCHI